MKSDSGNSTDALSSSRRVWVDVLVLGQDREGVAGLGWLVWVRLDDGPKT